LVGTSKIASEFVEPVLESVEAIASIGHRGTPV